MSDPDYILVDAIKALANQCELGMRTENSIWVTREDPATAAICFKANLMEFAKTHGQGSMTYEEIMGIDAYQIEKDMRDQNFILLLVIGIPGTVLSMGVMVVIGIKKEKTSFGKLSEKYRRFKPKALFYL